MVITKEAPAFKDLLWILKYTCTVYYKDKVLVVAAIKFNYFGKVMEFVNSKALSDL